MPARNLLCMITLLALAFFISCSNSDGNPALPVTDYNAPVAESSGNTLCLGLWQVTVNPDDDSINAAQLRSGDQIVNVLSFLEPPALSGMTIDFNTLQIDPGNNKVSVDVIIKHPIPDPVFRGFDVRGVVFGPRLTNADGHTPVMAPKHFAHEPFGYIDGMLGAPDSFADYNEDIYGYKYFCTGLGMNDNLADFFSIPANLDNRGSFEHANKLTRHYDIDWTDTGYALLIFNYAIYANYDWPAGELPIGLEDFPISTANSREAFCIKVTGVSSSLYYADGGGGGTISLDAEVWDWQNNIESVTVRSYDGIVIPETPGTYEGPGSTAYSHFYSFDDVPGTPTAEGNLDIVVSAIDPETFGEAWFLGLLSAGNPLYDEKVYSCYVLTTEVVDCMPPSITGIDPEYGWAGQEINMTISGTFIDGPDLAVRLEMAGESDIIATDVVLDGGSGDITCVLDLTDAAGGDWDVVVTNGCGADGSYPGGFEVKSCEGQNTCPTGSFSYVNHFVNFIHYPHYGTDATRASSTQYLICTGFKNTIEHRIIAYVPGSTTFAYISEIIGPYISSSELPRTLACDSNDRIYYRAGDTPNWLQYIDFDGGAGFGPKDQMFGIQIPWGSIRRVAIDVDDNPVILCYSGSELRIYKWNGTDWGSPVNVPGTVMSDNGSLYSNINDFEINPVTGDYLITTYYNPPKFYAVNTDGEIVFSDDDIWETGTAEQMYAGIFVDIDNPECRFILNGAPYIDINDPHYGETYFARCNPLYGEWTYTELPEDDYPFFDGLGSVVDVNGTQIFCGTSSYRWYSTYIEVPDW